jgi:hypothetical protein
MLSSISEKNHVFSLGWGMEITMRTLALKVLSAVLSFQTGIGIQLIVYSPFASATTSSKAVAQPAKAPTKAEIEALRNDVQAQYMRAWAEAMKTGFGGRDPALRDLMSTDLKDIKESIPDFTNAPVDADPFFMRSQTWLPNSEKVSDYAVVSDVQKTEILVPGVSRKLSLNIPLRNLIATDEYLFFTLHPKSDLFDRVAGVQNAEGDGLFVIETALLSTHANRGTPVPVFFLPIMGEGWRSDVTALQIVEGDILAIANKTEVIPFLMKDIREMIQISKINLDMSVMISLTKLGPDGKVAADKLMPAPGSTALFGLVVTGLDTTRPGYNFFRDFRSLTASNSRAQIGRFGSKSLALGALAALGLGVAHAQEAEDPVTAAIWRSAFFGSIVATTIVIAFALKYKSKAVRQRLDEIHKYRRALDPENRRQKRSGKAFASLCESKARYSPPSHNFLSSALRSPYNILSIATCLHWVQATTRSCERS